MSAERPLSDENAAVSEATAVPEISVCESRPGRSVFLESGNADGWIASDLTVDAGAER